jgi:hypothetical protein
MSGIYSRKLYDGCYEADKYHEETSSGSHRVNPIQLSQSSCIGLNTTTNYKGSWYSPNEVNNINVLADVESHLRNLDMPDSRCIDDRTLDKRNQNAKKIIGNFMYLENTCNRNLESRNSRLETSNLDVKMSTQTRFDFPIIDPRAQVYNGIIKEQSGSNRFGVNTRLQAKDMTPLDFLNKTKTQIII